MKSTGTFSLANRTVLLTGATGGLGVVAARELYLAGAHVLLNGRNPASLEKLASGLKKGPGRVSVMPFDLRNKAEVGEAVKKITGEFGSLEGLVQLAYGAPDDPAFSSDKMFESTYDIVVVAPFLLLEQALPLLEKGAKKAGGGASVVNVSSMYGLGSPYPDVYGKGEGNPPYYGAAKAAVHQLTRYWSCHLGLKNIRVNTLTPGPFPPAAILAQKPQFARKLRKKSPLGRTGEPKEIAGPLIFLLSEASSYVTGTNLLVDGGWTAW